MINKIYCDHCGYQLNDSDEDVPIVILELPNSETFLLHEDCMLDFLKEYTIDAYVLPNGAIER